jgi:hypothetical protein
MNLFKKNFLLSIVAAVALSAILISLGWKIKNLFSERNPLIPRVLAQPACQCRLVESALSAAPGSASVTCAADEILIAGGCDCDQWMARPFDSHPINNGWGCSGCLDVIAPGQLRGVKAVAWCCK